ncbi:3-hydroxybutyrate dehydrogenase [Thalassospira sp.]|uniref:3-hydroxybutyrate dehydrogenase n=1 Tax=Thalassospira sp. TaxID=1912094 RepID=UPI0027339217|nr:3-hydroxybutyrate dehydrogenase [Thalassospira sp.]MDP2698904.1 3-hydroxybutyrate dehydrogenase [Thalassospira sp.]
MLNGKRALVTGSTSGIGLAMARALAGAGADVMLNGFGDVDVIEKTRQGLEGEFGVKAFYNGADLCRPDEIAAMMDAAAQKLGGIDILINNAGIQHTALIEDFPTEKWDAVIAINLTSAFHTTRLALPYMKQQNWGRIINTASAHGLVASVQKSAYVAAKHGIVGLTKVTALETAETGITANAICPGWVRTELVERQIEAKAKEGGISIEEAATNLVSDKHPSKQFVAPEQIGQTALFLCSDAASQMTGTTLSVDGGWTAQ